MSETIYALLLHLFPSEFRDDYQKEALQLYRDRARDEKGFLSTIRLWLDLLVDATISAPSMRSQFRRETTSPAPRLAGGPSFHMLEAPTLRPQTLVSAGAMSFAAAVGFAILLNHQQSHSPFDENAARAFLIQTTAPAAKFGDAERHKVVEAAIDNIRLHYFDQAIAQTTAAALRAHEINGDDNAPADGASFAAVLTRQMHDASGDVHLSIDYFQSPIPDRSPEPSPEDLARYQATMKLQNCTIEKVEILPHNIGYLKLNSFPDPAVCGPQITDAMKSLDQSNAIIFDLRDNTGGYPAMVSLIAAFLFDHPEFLFNPKENPTTESWTRSPVAGSRLADKPVYVLTSHRTYSAAEGFTYDLKMLKRATLVGETTGGGAHAGVFHRIDAHFGMGIPEVRVVNPYGKPDWEGIGVEPDFKVNPSVALDEAIKLAIKKSKAK